MSLLRAARLDLLVELLKPYAAELAAFDVDLGEAEHSASWLHALYSALNCEDPRLPDSLLSALIQIADLATDEGAQLLTTEGWHRQVSVFARQTIVSNEDLAISVYLRHPDVFQTAHGRLQSFHGATVEEFYGRGRGVGVERYRGDFSELGASLSDAFTSEHPPGFCRVRVDERKTELVVVVEHGRFRQRGRVIAERHRRRLGAYAIESYDVVVYDKRTDRLSIQAQSPAHREVHRAAMGALIALDETYFQRYPLFRSDPLYERGSAALSIRGVDGLERVLLRHIILVGEGREEGLRARGGEDLGPWLDEARRNGILAERTIRQWSYGVVVAGTPVPVEVEILSPNQIRFDRRVPMTRFRQFLRAGGFFVAPFDPAR